MRCPNCNNDMLVRSGRFGEFYYCPNQFICKAKTISKSNSTSNIDNVWCEPDLEGYGRSLSSLLPNYTEAEVREMYDNFERSVETGGCLDWEDFYIGH